MDVHDPEDAVRIEAGTVSVQLDGNGLTARRDDEDTHVRLTEIGHIEHKGATVTIRWGIRSDRSEQVDLDVGMLTAADRFDELEQFLEHAAPGHLFSLCDDDGIRYSREFEFGELSVPMEPCRRITSRLLPRRGNTWLAKIGEEDCRIERRRGFVVMTERYRGEPVLSLYGNQLAMGNGMVLGVVQKDEEHGRFTIAFGHGSSLARRGRSRMLQLDGVTIGKTHGLGVQLEGDHPKILLFAAWLALIDLKQDQVREGTRADVRFGKRGVAVLLALLVIFSFFPLLLPKGTRWIATMALLVLYLAAMKVLVRRPPAEGLVGEQATPASERSKSKRSR